MIDLSQQPERVLIMAVKTDRYTDEQFTVLVDEMERLADTAGGEVIETITQNLPKLDGRTAVGSGKLQEIQALIEAREIDLVICLNALTPSMNRNLDEALSVRVIDRVQLILDIFAMRARSKEGKLQVALAQYNYLLPRLQGQGKHLSRQGGGIGVRGPGETKLESDRRHIRATIQRIKEELAVMSEHRERTRLRRQGGAEFNIGLVGYTNAGKSTLLSQLTQQETYIQDQLFATLDPLTRKLTIGDQTNYTVTDTVGFIEELPTELIHAFKSTLEEIRYMDLLLHVVDASDSARHLHEQTVSRLLSELEVGEIPVLTVYNKVDLVEGQVVPTLFPSIALSAYQAEDIERLKQAIYQELTQSLHFVEYQYAPEQYGDLMKMRQQLLVTSCEFDETSEHYRLAGYRRYSQQERPLDE